MDVLDIIYYAIKNLLSPIKTHMSKWNILWTLVTAEEFSVYYLFPL